MTKIGNEMSVFPDRYIQFLGDMINQKSEEMDVLDKNVRILHPHNASALEFTVLQVKMQFTTALGLTLVLPIDTFTSLGGEGNRNNGALRQRLRLETINDVGDLCLHLLCYIVLCFSIMERMTW
jgi:hypothetical protein